ncbi:membrane-spanning 4-domains subfamily A member 8 [Myotis lucifugus]|uniref:membrane-spanning 4-domains subfamily A member 8 n=1 Tax=Myotis lucifugus TaxID=59463 RepID=UPI0006D705EE|nr:membrane-spanning 4-domains subfamily A member 8 [Myotis lucifugus]
MNSMTSAGSQANTVFVMAPHNGYPVIPGRMSQVPQYPLNQPQVHTISGNLHGLEPPVPMQPDQRSFKDGKVLGAIQILIGLIHIGLGIIMGTIIPWGYTAISFYGGYPFWGGILFIISGSLSVASENLPRSPCLSSGLATSAVLFIFSLLEFCIACTSAHFGCKLLHHSHNSDVGRGNLAVLTIFTILEFFIAVIATHFGHQATLAQANAEKTLTEAAVQPL